MGEPLLAPALRSLAQRLHQEDGKGVALLLPFLLAGGYSSASRPFWGGGGRRKLRGMEKLEALKRLFPGKVDLSESERLRHGKDEGYPLARPVLAVVYPESV